jgi:hypothetical protein
MNYLFILLTIISGYNFNRLSLFPDGIIATKNLLIGDTNHNGLDEIIIPGHHHTIWEYKPVNQFVEVYIRAGSSDTSFCPYDVGDGDRDGFSDLIGTFTDQSAGGYKEGTAILESKDAHSYPDSFTWVNIYSLYENEYLPYRFTDLDSDGNPDLFGSWYSYSDEIVGSIIYENRGDNYYVPVWQCTVGDYRGSELFGDFDGDGKRELFSVIGWSGDSAYTYECTGDDSYKLTWVGHHKWINIYDNWLGNDTDQDGKPEIFMKDYWYGSNPGAALTMYEATGDNTYNLVEIDTIRGSMDALEGLSCCGDVDGDSVEEVVVSVGTRVIIYKATGDDKYERVWEWDNDMGDPLNGYTAVVACHDFNKNGYDEVVISGSGKTSVFEIDKASITESKTKPLGVARISVTPNLIKNSATIKYSIPNDGRVELTVYDAVGRMVKKLINKDLKAGAYTIAWRETALPAGIYFVRLKTQDSILTDKVIVAK